METFKTKDEVKEHIELQYNFIEKQKTSYEQYLKEYKSLLVSNERIQPDINQNNIKYHEDYLRKMEEKLNNLRKSIEDITKFLNSV